MFTDWKITITKICIFSKSIYSYIIITIKMPMTFIIEQISLKNLEIVGEKLY